MQDNKVFPSYSRKTKARLLYKMWLEADGDSAKFLADELKALKKASKVSWKTLGLPEDFTLN